MTEERVIVGIVGLTPDNDEESIDMDELSKSEVADDTEIEGDTDKEPDATLGDDDEIEEVEAPEED